MTTTKTFRKSVNSVHHKIFNSSKKVHHRLIAVRKHYIDTSTDDDDLSIVANIQPENFDKINKKENSSITKNSNDVLCFNEHSKECSYLNEDVVPDGVTHSSITIVRSHDKATSTSPLHTSTAVDSSTFSLASPKYSSKSTQTIDMISTPIIKKTTKRKEKKKKIARRLNLTIQQLQECKDDNDIRKTCRSITKCLYPDKHTQASLTISKMSNQQKKDIRDYAKLLHPDQRDTQKYFLNNAIGNVFASEKIKKKKKKKI